MGAPISHPLSSAGDVASLRYKSLNVVICDRVKFCLTTTTIVLGISASTLTLFNFSYLSKNRAVASMMTSEIDVNTTSGIIRL